MSGSLINGMIGTSGQPVVGDKFGSGVTGNDPYTVVVNFPQPFDKTPIGLASVAGTGNQQSTCIVVACSNTSMTISTNGSTAVPLFFMATDKGLGYY